MEDGGWMETGRGVTGTGAEGLSVHWSTTNNSQQTVKSNHWKEGGCCEETKGVWGV